MKTLGLTALLSLSALTLQGCSSGLEPDTFSVELNEMGSGTWTRSTVVTIRSNVAEPIEVGLLESALQFAYAMVYGDGHHRDHRSGGITHRKKGEVFCNTFQGKLAEVSLHRLFKTHNLNVDEVDYNVYGEGAWDDCDLTVNGKRINIKSAASFANLLLLEAKDWDEYGNYLPNAFAGETAQYDYFVLVRFKPDIKSLFQAEEMFYSNHI